jgi:hypothetical protein
MLRKVNDSNFLFLCQSSNWQCVVIAEDEESAATSAIEKVMKLSEDDEEERYSLSMVVSVKKLSINLIEPNIDEESISFYSPIILANAGFHTEASKLHKFLEEKIEENNE